VRFEIPIVQSTRPGIDATLVIDATRWNADDASATTPAPTPGGG
jgi:hypothetical protein